MMEKRIEWIDCAKIIAIMAVVTDHYNGFPGMKTTRNIQDISVMHTYLQENYKAGTVELVETYQGWNIYKFFDEDQL